MSSLVNVATTKIPVASLIVLSISAFLAKLMTKNGCALTCVHLVLTVLS